MTIWRLMLSVTCTGWIFGPVLILIKVSVSSNALTWWVGMSQQSVRPIKGVVVSMLCRIRTAKSILIYWGRACSFRPSPESGYGFSQCHTELMQQLLCTFWSKADHNVSVSLAQPLKGQRGYIGPNVERIANGSVYISLLQIWCIIQNPETSGIWRAG